MVTKKIIGASSKSRHAPATKPGLFSPWMIIGALALLVVVAIITFAANKPQADTATFAGCLVDKGFAMAGTSWCSHCKAQKDLFQGAFEDVIIPRGGYVDCEQDAAWCDENVVRGYPTWITPDGAKLEGTQKLATLAKVSGCPMN